VAFRTLGWDLKVLVSGKKYESTGNTRRRLDEELPPLAPERPGNSFDVVQEMFLVTIFEFFEESFQV
jgi:hypothetical protein